MKGGRDSMRELLSNVIAVIKAISGGVDEIVNILKSWGVKNTGLEPGCIEIGGVKHYRDGVTVKQYRYVLRYIQMVESEPVVSKRLREQFRLLAILYNNKITSEELKEVFESGLMGSPSDFISFVDGEVKEVLGQVQRVYGEFTYLYPVPDTPNKSKGEQKDEGVRGIRKMVIKWYQVYVLENQVLTLTELDGMYLEDMVDINQSLTKTKVVMAAEPEFIDDLNTRFGRNKAQDGGDR